jgi:hypothetical protein
MDYNSSNPILGKTLILLIAFSLLSCSYSFKGSLPPHLKTVSLPIMENETSEFGVAEEITTLLREQFLREGLLRVTDPERANSELLTSLKKIDERDLHYDADELVSLKKITINVSATFTDFHEDRVLWSANFSEWGDYDPQLENRDDAISEAVEKLVLSINQKLLSDW